MDPATRNLPPEYRAPPPSPAAGSRSSSEDDEFGGFLTRSLRVPELFLPDRILGRGCAPWNPPELDFRSLISTSGGPEAEVRAAAAAGCFQIVNHGIAKEVIEGVEVLAGEAFRLPLEKRRAVTGSREVTWGFGEDEEEKEMLWWKGGRGEELAGIWPRRYKDIRSKLERLRIELEKIASKIRTVLLLHNAHNAGKSSTRLNWTSDGSTLFLYKDACSSKASEARSSSLQRETLQMLIRSSAHSSSLALHICRGASRFRVYSKKGCLHFPVKDGAIVVTVGEQMQAWSNGIYKHVVGKPIFENDGDSVSIALLYSPTDEHACDTTGNEERSISLVEQVMIAACLTLLYQIIVYIWGST